MIYLKLDNVPLFEAYEDEIEQAANGKYQLSFKFPCSSDKWHLFTKETLLLADDLHGEQEFRIFEIVKRNGYLRIYANQIADDLNYKSITKLSVDRVPGQTVMTALAGSIIQEHNFSFYSDIPDRHKFNQSDVTVMDALSKGKHSIIGQWGGELVRDKYQVKLMKKAGIDSEVLFMYKKNLDSFDQSESTKGLITRLHLKKVVESEETKMELKVTVDSPLISRYELIYEANIEVQDENIATIEQLRQYGVDYFRKNLPDIPENSLSISVADSSEYPVRLFDTAIVHHELYGIDMRMQITSYKYSPVSKRLKSVGFGKIKTSLMQQTKQDVQEIEDKVDIKILEQGRQLQKEIDNANRHFEAEFEKGKQAIADGIEVAKAKSEQFKSELESKIDSEIKPLANEAKQEASRANQSIASQTQNIERVRIRLIESKQEIIDQVNRTIAKTFDRVETLRSQTQRTLSGEIAAVSQTLSETKRNLLEQANAQTELSSRVTTVEETANGTKTTVTELQKTVNAATGNLESVSRRTRTVEDNLSGLTTKIENIRVGAVNLFSQKNYSHHANSGHYDAAKWTSAFCYVESGQTYTISYTVTDSNRLNIVSNSKTKPLETWSSGTVLVPWKETKNGERIVETITIPESDNVIVIYLSNQKNNAREPDLQIEKGTIATDYSPSEIDKQAELATYKQTVDRNFAELTRTTQTVTDRVTEYKSALDQTAEHFRTSLNALEAFKNDEGARESRYLSLSREETARQLQTVRSDITRDYVSKSQLTETTRGIEQRFERLTTGRNLVKNSKIKESSNVYDFAQRTVELEAGKTYLFMARAKKTGGSAGKTVRIYLYNRAWSESTHLEFRDNDYETLTTSFTPRESGRYYISSYWFPNGGDRSGTADVDWYMVVEGGIRPSDWLPHVDDASSELATYKNTVDRQLSELSSTINANNSAFTTFKNSYERTAQGVTEKLTALEAYKNNEHLRSNAYLEASKTETAKQLQTLRTAISEDYIAKSRYEADATGIRERFEGLSVGGDNLLISDKFLSNRHILTETTTKHVAGSGTYYFGYEVDFKPNKDYILTISSIVVTGGNAANVVVRILSNNLQTKKQELGTLLKSGENIVLKFTTSDQVEPGDKLLFYTTWGTSASYVIKEIQLLEGSLVRSWQASQKEIETRLATFERGLQGIEGKFITLNNEVMKTNSFTINENGIVLQSGRTFDGRTIASLLTVNDDNIKAITDRMIITPNNENLIHPNFRSGITINKRETVFPNTHTIDLKNDDEFLIKWKGVRNTSQHFGILLYITYEDSTKDWKFCNFKEKSVSGRNDIETTFKVTGLRKKVRSWQIGCYISVSSNLGSFTVESFEMYQKKSASLIVDGSITGRHVKANSLETGHHKAGSVTAEILGANAVTADKLLVNQALIDKLVTDDLLANKIIASSAFITKLDTIEFSANRVTSGILASRNGAISWDLDKNNLILNQTAKIQFNSFYNQLVIENKGNFNGSPTSGGVAVTKTKNTENVSVVFGTSSGRTFDINDVSFTGLRIHQTDYHCGLYGSTIDISDTFDSDGHTAWTNAIYVSKDRESITISSRNFSQLSENSRCTLQITPNGITVHKNGQTRTLI